MPPTKPLVRAIVVFSIVFGLLSVPWPGWQEGYSKAFRWAGNTAFGTFGDKGLVKFLPAQRVNRTADTEITTKIEGSRYTGVDEVSPRLMGYLPTVELLALIVASAVTWGRRLLALLSGLLLVHTFFYFRLWILIRVYFSSDNPWRQYNPGPNTLAVLKHINEVINISPTTSFVVPVLIWIAVTFRFSDWERITRRQPSQTESSPS